MENKQVRAALSPFLLENIKIGDEIFLSGRKKDCIVGVFQYGAEYHGKKLSSFDFKVEKNDENRLKALCEHLASLRHPNVVLFVGVTFTITSTPVLVCEALPHTVASALNWFLRFPDCLQLSILCDVSRALVFLHCRQKPIVHGDITATSIYLTNGLQAKLGIGSGGVADCSTSESIKADVFSLGVLALHIVCGKCPVPTSEASAVDELKELVDSMKHDQCLATIIRSCLSNDSQNRPTSLALLRRSQELSRQNPMPFTTALELLPRMERRESEMMAMAEQQELEQKKVARIGKQSNSYDEQMSIIKKQMKRTELVDSIPLNHHALNNFFRPQKDTNRTSTVMLDEAESGVSRHLKPTQKIFQWKSSSKAPTGMRAAASVVLEGKFYVGGGETPNFQTDCTLYEYDINGLVQKWTALPICPVAYYGLGIVNRSLVLIGGMDVSTRCASDKLFLWDKDKQGWVPSLPRMPTARQHPSVSMYDLLVIVAGGYRNTKALAEVEVFDQATFQWQALPALPIPCAGATSCIVLDILYLIGGTLYGESGPQNTVQAFPLTSSPVNSKWVLCKDTPLTLTCAVPSSNYVLAVGGSYSGSTVPNRAIHVYFPSLDRWELLCEMPTARNLCNASVLSAGKLLVFGGKEDKMHPVEYGSTVEMLMV